MVFLLDHVLAETIEHREASKTLKAVYTLPGSQTNVLEDIADVLVRSVESTGTPVAGADLVREFLRSPLSQERYETIIHEPIQVARDFYGSGLAADSGPGSHEETRVVLDYAAAVRELEQNIFIDKNQDFSQNLAATKRDVIFKQNIMACLLLVTK